MLWQKWSINTPQTQFAGSMAGSMLGCERERERERRGRGGKVVRGDRKGNWEVGRVAPSLIAALGYLSITTVSD